MEIKSREKLLRIGVSEGAIHVISTMHDLGGGTSSESKENSLPNVMELVEFILEQKGSEFTKTYLELQAERIDALLSAEPQRHQKSLEALHEFLKGEVEKTKTGEQSN